MSPTGKGKSPFFPGQPVPWELFVGRAEQINRILVRGAGQVAAGKPVTMYVQGEYGIGKTSVADFVQKLAKIRHKLFPIYVQLGGTKDIEDLAAATLEAVTRSGAIEDSGPEKLRGALAKYFGKQELFGFSIDLTAIKADAPRLARPVQLLGFLGEVFSKLAPDGYKGVFLVFDEINGITADPKFSHFIKGLVDQNAIAARPMPLLLMLCGVEEKRREMIATHPPVDRIFDVIEISSLGVKEVSDFFRKAFQQANITMTDDAVEIMARYSAGFPKIMHLIGDAAFWQDRDGVIDHQDAMEAVYMAADEVGKKYVDQQVYRALKSSDYHSILAKIAKMGPASMSFTKAQVARDLTADETRKFNNFVQKMKRLKVIRSGEVKGEWVFNSRMERLYIWLQSN